MKYIVKNLHTNMVMGTYNDYAAAYAWASEMNAECIMPMWAVFENGREVNIALEM